MSGKAGIGALMCGRGQCPFNPQNFATPTSRFWPVDAVEKHEWISSESMPF
jgi:hypothetical protein